MRVGDRVETPHGTGWVTRISRPDPRIAELVVVKLDTGRRVLAGLGTRVIEEKE